MKKIVKICFFCFLLFQLGQINQFDNNSKATILSHPTNNELYLIMPPPFINSSSYPNIEIQKNEMPTIDQDEHINQKSISNEEKQTYELIIITLEENYDAILSSNFVPWKNLIGFNIKIVNITDNEIQSETGIDLPQKIRNFLRNNYQMWESEYVLIIGSHSTIPMRYCYPNPENHIFDIFEYTSGEVPTDYYYADLTDTDQNSWDFDNDGYYGEYGEDYPNLQAEVFVGRIPTDNPSRITYTLDKTVSFEQDTQDWKHHALHAGAFYYFTNEDGSGYPSMDGAVVSHYIEQDLMDGWTINHYNEQEGLETSTYPWPQLTEASFIDDWRNGQYAIVNWQGHGWTNGVARKVWSWDDGDGIPEGNEISWPYFITMTSNLDDDYPSIVTALSCYVGCPEISPDGNLGIDLLTDPSNGAAIGVIASSRSPYGDIDWPETPAGSESIIYEFNRFFINDAMKLGEALYESKYFCFENYGWEQFAEYNDKYCINLFGDPSLTLEGINSFYADYMFAPEIPLINDTIIFTDNSVDLYGTIINWSWNFDDGNTSYSQHPIHQYEKSGVYSVCLTIENDQSNTDAICKDIIVLNDGESIDVNQMMFDRGFPIRHAIDGDWAAAQNFASTLSIVTRCDIYLRKFGTPEFNLTVELREDHPQGPLVDVVIYSAEDVSSNWEWFNIDFADTAVTPDTNYFIVIPPVPSGVTTSFGYEWGYAFGNQYDDGAFWFTRDGGGLWRDLPTMYEFVFRAYGYY